MGRLVLPLIFVLAAASITPSTAQTLVLGAIAQSTAQILDLSAVASSTAQILNLSATPFNFLPTLAPTVTQINCYYQNIASGTTEDSYGIANSSITNQSFTRFGFLDIDDVLLTEGPDPTSNVIGLAQGLFGSADLNTLGFLLEFNVYFPSGPYNGSTLHISGRDSPFLSYRELAVTGGTHYFRLAKGFVTMSTVFGNNSTMNATFEFNITVYHPNTVVKTMLGL
ncbi:hypothetical protein MLD38_013494 [Melastoma candidum]|uniref:Uncharacterized protein n=3 Tax=Melastoma candidum TaxID=119954 RepID=A0ACB9R9P9_9MYRT|nr:hypothetical protein MLD38_013488 [Melastoma candidum]KAI4375643.1 hypothetical protein MLD38_013491 [Melastoma candidum]KAI4375646.1 hypothetical protein MLD38_013494 [Melastoma candidum]